MRPNAFTFLLPILAASCTSISAGPDRLCTQIAEFANTLPDQAVHAVNLTTDWGGVFTSDEKVLAAKHCEHGGYAPGQSLCEYLLANTSTEFATANFRSVLACLGDDNFDLPTQAYVESFDIRVSSEEARGVTPNVTVTVEFSTGAERTTPPSLKIAAQRQ